MNTEFTSCEDCEINNALVCNTCIHQGIKTDMFTPKQKIIDLSVCIESGIDMEFCDNDFNSVIGKLQNIDDSCSIRFFYKNTKSRWRKCRVRENHWIAWLGGACPLPEGLKVEVMFRDGEHCKMKNYIHYVWDHSNEGGDIIAFKVLGTELGWKYELG